ncbi:hypothetical protein PROFUN_05344 [Planoprotostelium fungivorum]|uniref:Tautomerase cis-CaaD-like domain-containing protein n=1 Tax=Planoprotostelium fungivorum TaxID=1890364 RepID=A0A2P6NR47_9EUKA|nr:hypothetical protein PROFUN_05344 [Planoprotostelium fungivorum]
MPFYQIFHAPGTLSREDKTIIAKGFTETHCSIAGATPYVVKVAFIDADIYTSGEHDDKIIRIVGIIKGGRTFETKSKLLEGLSLVITPFLGEKMVEITLVENHAEDMKRVIGKDLLN